MPANGAASSPVAPPEGYAELLRAMNRLAGLLNHVWSPQYEYSPAVTFGGATGRFQLNPYFDTPGEWTVLQWAANDATTGTLGVNDDGAPSDTTVYDPSTYKPNLPIVTAGALTVPGIATWMPIGRQNPLYLNITVANSKAAWVTVQFRRRVNSIGVVAQGS
jgi:hypothetical protein